MTQQTKQQTSQEHNVGSRVKEAASEVKSEAVSATREASEELKAEAKAVASDLRGTVEGSVRQGKSQVASQIGGFASALYDAGSTLDQENHNSAARYTQQLGQQVEKVAGYLEERRTRDILADLEDFARRHPAIFLGGSLLAGVAVARFLKSTERSS